MRVTVSGPVDEGERRLKPSSLATAHIPQQKVAHIVELAAQVVADMGMPEEIRTPDEKELKEWSDLVHDRRPVFNFEDKAMWASLQKSGRTRCQSRRRRPLGPMA